MSNRNSEIRRTLVRMAMQRYWRVTRSLTMGAQGVVLSGDNRVMLVRHAYRPGWHFPGGGVERNESAVTALSRELVEEAGVHIEAPPELFGLYGNFRVFPCDHIALFVVRQWRQPHVPEPNREIAEVGSFGIDDLPEGTIGAVHRRLEEIVGGAPMAQDW